MGTSARTEEKEQRTELESDQAEEPQPAEHSQFQQGPPGFHPNHTYTPTLDLLEPSFIPLCTRPCSRLTPSSALMITGGRGLWGTLSGIEPLSVACKDAAVPTVLLFSL